MWLSPWFFIDVAVSAPGLLYLHRIIDAAVLVRARAGHFRQYATTFQDVTSNRCCIYEVLRCCAAAEGKNRSPRNNLKSNCAKAC